ncbi:hypothetical protein [Pseudomonas fitomaticsae]|uniref:Uncharacterized protein n=1 Tax=Pseudomonas fitomaticsae TaxID=2837969 RepID=A0ABY3PYZ6_9PSED|nr:hypothetical protein [Pseudomonas fitomaticsae]UFP99158.1 hypothetical protein KJY40_24465 [Pseudomonas fitomaticsae]
MKRTTAWLGILAALAFPSVEAANQEIRALFQPDPSQPNKNVFVNKTPNSGYCVVAPAQCAENKMFSIQIPVRFVSNRAIAPGDDVSLRVPANWRRLTVTHQGSGETETVEVRIIGIGSKYGLSDTAVNLTGAPNPLEGHRKLWRNNSWVNAPAPCSSSSLGFLGPSTYTFFWRSWTEATCTKVAAYRIPSMSFDALDFAYELRTPNPLGMSSGLYTGSLSYTLGPSGDFQMGAMMVPDDGNLTLDFVLDVQHTLKVELPPGGNKIALEPAGGWQHWIDSGRRPTEIFRDQPFFISSSSRFKVMLQCSSLGGSDCDIGNNQVGFSKFQIRLTMPPGIKGPGGHDGWSGTLSHNMWIGPFEPGRYIDRKQGMLRFFISPRFLDFLRPGMNGTLTGNATIIFDSEV